MGVGGRPDARRDTDDHRRHQHGAAGDDERQSRDPAECTHSGDHATGASPASSGSPPHRKMPGERRPGQSSRRCPRHRSSTRFGAFRIPRVGSVRWRRVLRLSATTVPLRRPAHRRADRAELGGDGASNGRPRLLGGQHARPLHRPARSPARPAGRARRHDDPARRRAGVRQRLQASARARQGAGDDGRAVRRPSRDRPRGGLDGRRTTSRPA